MDYSQRGVTKNGIKTSLSKFSLSFSLNKPNPVRCVININSWHHHTRLYLDNHPHNSSKSRKNANFLVLLDLVNPIPTEPYPTTSEAQHNSTTPRQHYKTSFTRTVNVTVIVIGAFVLYDGHFDGENGYTTHFACQIVDHH